MVSGLVFTVPANTHHIALARNVEQEVSSEHCSLSPEVRLTIDEVAIIFSLIIITSGGVFYI